MKFTVIPCLCIFIYLTLYGNGVESQSSLPALSIEREDVDTWEAPEDIQKAFPFYISGYDKEGRKVLVVEFSRWDIRGAVEAGGERLESMNKQSVKLVRQIREAGRKASADSLPDDVENVVGAANGAVLITDLENFDFRQLLSTRTTLHVLQMARLFLSIEEYMDYGYFINVNAAAQTLLTLIKPVLGAFFDKLSILGTNKERWIPTLLARIPKDQLPEWYGGSPNFKPVQTYG